MLMALVHRQRTGQGQYVENPQLNATMTHVAHIVRRADGEVLGAERLDPLQFGFSALERLYETADGWICLVVKSDRELAALRSALSPTLDDERFASLEGCTVADDELAVLLDQHFAARSAREVVEQLAAAGVPVAQPVAAAQLRPRSSAIPTTSSSDASR